MFDPVGGSVFDESVRCLAWNGRLRVVGFASGQISKFPVNLALVKNISVVGVDWGAYARTEPGTMRDSMRSLFEMHARGDIRPADLTTYPLARAPQALAALMQRRASGKLVVELD